MTGGGCTGRLAFDPAALAAFQRGLRGVVDGLTSIGSEGTVDSGAALSNCELSAWNLGHTDLPDALNEVVERGRWLLHGSLEAIEAVTARLTDTGTLYQKADDAAAAVFRRLQNDFTGDPASGDGGGAS